MYKIDRAWLTPIQPIRRIYRLMKTFKKLTAVGLTLTSVMSLVACGNNNGGSNNNASSNKEVTKPDKFTVMVDSAIVTEANGAQAFYKYLSDLTALKSNGYVLTTVTTMMQFLMHSTVIAFLM